MESGKLQSVLGAPQKIVEQKRASSKKRIWPLIILGVLVLVMIVWALPPNISKTLFSPAPPYKKELKKAKRCSEHGFANMMEEHLTKAKWDAREKGVDISEKVKEIYAKGSVSVLESALTRALYGHTDPAKCTLIRYKRYCSKAEIPPDDKKIAEVETIIRRNQ